MGELTDDRVDGYIEALYDDGDEVREEMEALARELGFPIVGVQVGRLLQLLSQSIGARRVFELGSGYGYSALFFARAVGPEGEVHCTDLSAENVTRAERFLRRAGVWDRVIYHRGDAVAALEAAEGPWDVVYNDIDKDGYPATIDIAHSRLRTGGLFITDNLLWHGRVLPGGDDGSAETEGVRIFTARLLDHPGFATTILPIRDGVAVALKR